MPGWFHKSGSQRPPSGEGSEDGSARESAKVLRDGLRDHLHARAELLGIEAREASEVVAHKGTLGIAAVALLFFAYALLLLALISLLGLWVESWSENFAGFGWQLAAIGAGSIHFLIALILIKKLKRKPAQPLFEYSRAEFHKDRAWLNPPKSSDSENKNSR
jgi:uncharacterized membrane protein YqjE